MKIKITINGEFLSGDENCKESSESIIFESYNSGLYVNSFEYINRWVGSTIEAGLKNAVTKNLNTLYTIKIENLEEKED